VARGPFGGQASYAYEMVRQMILHGELAPGTRLGVRELSQRLGTSNGPVRDALIQLRNEQLVQGGHGRDWCVTELTREMIDGAMVVREALEAQSARCCALRAKPEDIEKLRALAEQVDARVAAGLGSDEITSEIDARFHAAIAEVSGSAQLCHEVERWKVVMEWARIFMGAKRLAGESHLKLVEAIASGDADFAERQMRRHVLHPWQEEKWKVSGSGTAGRDEASKPAPARP